MSTAHRAMPAYPRTRQPEALARGSHASHPYDLWTSDGQAQRAIAAQICRSCPVAPQCLAYSLTLPATDSAIWAGLDARERAALRRSRRTRQAGSPT
jgi:Transcription factor WhiB